MRFLLLAFFTTTTATSYAAPDFEQSCGGPDFDRGVFVSPTRDHGYVAIGVTRSFGAGNEDVYLVRADSTGDILWSKTFGGADDDNGWSVVEAPDGFVLAGFTNSSGNGDFDFYLVKTNQEGKYEWSKTFGGEGRDRCWSMARTDDGGYVLAGETSSFGEGEEDCYLVKTDSLGTMLWSQTYGGKKSDRCFAVVQAGDGGYVLAGQTYSEGAGDRDAYVIKTSSRGELKWSKTFGGEASDVGHSVIKTSDGDFLVTGYTTSFATTGDDPYLIKIDAQGKILWTRVLSMEGTNHTLTGDQAVDGGFYLVGFTAYRNQGITAAVLIKTDAEGHLAWHRDFRHANRGEMFGYTVRATADGGCIFTGHTTSGSGRDLDLLLVKVEGEVQR
jgi:hypothetical protein